MSTNETVPDPEPVGKRHDLHKHSRRTIRQTRKNMEEAFKSGNASLNPNEAAQKSLG